LQAACGRGGGHEGTRGEGVLKTANADDREQFAAEFNAFVQAEAKRWEKIIKKQVWID